MAVEIDELQIEIEANSSKAANHLDQLTTSLEKLKSVSKGGAGLTTTANQITKLSQAAQSLSSISLGTGKLQELSNALNGLSGIQKASGLTSTLNALNKLPKITESLKSADLDQFSTQMTRVSNAVRPLATEMQKVSNGFSAFPIRIQKIISSNAGLVQSNNAAAKSYGVLGTGISSVQAKMGIYAVLLRRVAGVMSGWVTESNKYVEDLNLFTVAMGSAAQEAYDYAQSVKEALGIDPAEWMRNQGVFKQITSGFGVVSDKANLMSKNLTQIGYDIASFFNIKIEDAMQKVQSGIAGELEPLRRLGYALDVATLQEIAYKNGIEQKVNSMTQAQKSQLRYLAIMQQSTNVMGDMARTIITPANAMRILNQQMTQLNRALGNLLIPMLIQIVPYVQAFVEVLTEAIQKLAVMVGFELPEIDYGNVGDVGGAFDDATESAKELKRTILGFDELNILSKTKDQATTGTGNDLGIDLPQYDFLANLRKETEKYKEQMKDLLDVVVKVGAAFLAWKIGDRLLKDISGLTGTSTTGGMQNFAGAVIAGAGAISYLSGALNELRSGQVTWSGFVQLLSGSIGIIGGLSLAISPLAGALAAVASGAGMYFLALKDLASGNVNAAAIAQGMTGLGIAAVGLAFALGSPIAGVGLALAGVIVGIGAAFYGLYQKAALDELSRRFGNVSLSLEELRDIAANILTSAYLDRLQIALEDLANLDLKFDSLKEASNSIQKLTIKAEIYGELSPDESNSLGEQINAYVSDAQAYMDDLRQTTVMSFAIVMEPIGGTDNPFVSGMMKIIDTSIADMQSDLDKAGKDLANAYKEAMTDGIIGTDDADYIAQLQAEYQRLLDAATNAEYEANLSIIKAKGAINLTPESFVGLQEQLNEIAADQIFKIDDATVKLVTPSIQAIENLDIPDEVKAVLKDAIANAATGSGAIEGFNIELKSVNVQTETLKKAFGDAIMDIAPTLQQEISGNTDIQSVISNALNFPGEIDSTQLASQMQFGVESAYTRLRSSLGSLATDANISQEMFDNVKVTSEQLESLRQKFIEAGMQVPDALKQGISDTNQAAALGGSIDAIYAILGEQLSQSNPEVIQLLQTSKEFASSIPPQVAAGIATQYDLVYNATTGMYDQIRGAATGNELQTLVSDLNGLGSDIVSQIPDSMLAQMGLVRNATSGLIEIIGITVNESQPQLSATGNNVAGGIVEGFSFKDHASKIKSSMQEFNNIVMQNWGIHSPSTVFRDKIGKFLGIGTIEGFSETVSILPKLASGIVKDTQNAIKPIDMSKAGFTPERMNVSSNVTANVSQRHDFTQSAEAANFPVINAIYAMASQIVKAVESKDNNVYLDREKISRAAAEDQRRISHNRGPSLVKGGAAL